MPGTGALERRISSPLGGPAPLKFQPVKDYLPSPSACQPARPAAIRVAGLAMWLASAGASATMPAPGANVAAAPAPAWFNQIEPLASQATRAAFAGRPGLRVEVIPGNLDPRLKLAPCNKVQPYLPAGHRAWGHTRIGLRCVEGPVAWNVTMPLTVKVYAPALVARQPLSAGTALGPEHLEEAEAEWTASESPVFTDIQGLLGRALTRPMAPGQAVRESDLRKRQWFAAGDPVKLLVSGNGFSISGEGTALAPGLEGQLVRVRTEGGRVVSGRAKGDRMVEVDL